jgi:hypothetical protein
MATFNLIRTTFRMLPLLAVLGASRNALATTMYSAPLPIINLNNAADGSRSNIAPVESNFSGVPFILGDSFNLSSAGISGTYNVSTFTVWEVGNQVLSGPTDPGGTPPASEFSDITLYGGPDSTGLVAPESSTYAATRTFYTGGLNYQDVNTGQYFPIYELDFTNVNWTLTSGTVYDFAIGATPIGGNSFALSAANVGNSGVIMNGADNTFLLFTPTGNPSTPWVATYNSDSSTVPGFPEGADINVQIDLVQAVPEPQTLTLFAVGLGGILVGLRRRRRK